MSTGEAGMAARHDKSSRATRRQGLIVVLAIAAIAALITINLAFSTKNTNSTIDGRTATTSQFFGGP